VLFPWQSHHWQHLQGDTFPSHLTKIYFEVSIDSNMFLTKLKTRSSQYETMGWSTCHFESTSKIPISPLCWFFFIELRVGPLLLPLQIFIFSKEDNLQWKHPTHNLILWYLGNSFIGSGQCYDIMVSGFKILPFVKMWQIISAWKKNPNCCN
jgi:hypothetical protein